MIEQEITIINRLGLHARAAAKFVGTSGRFCSSIRVAKGSHEVDGKSIMAVMMLAASKGTQLNLKIDGHDEREALQAIIDLINNRFDEGE